MFENLLHQDQVKDALSRGLEEGRLPPAFLFAGPAHSGKMTAALELARSLSCKTGGAPWSCTCASCSQHRLLDSPHLLLMGRRRFADEIYAAGKMFRQTENKNLQILFHRNSKKLIRRFDPLLWRDDTTKLNKAGKLIERLESVVDSSAPDLTALTPLITDIEKLLPADGVTINMIRRAIYWSRTADRSVPKTIIIENAENLNESSRNGLLKILEEPPQQTFFILTTERLEAIISTIRSRLRLLNFIPRKREEFQHIISRVYRSTETGRYGNIQAFFDDMREGRSERQKKMVELMFLLLREKDLSARNSLLQLLGSDRQALKQLIILCLENLQDIHSSGTDCFDMQRRLEEMNYRSETYNIPVASVLEHGYI